MYRMQLVVPVQRIVSAANLLLATLPRIAELANRYEIDLRPAGLKVSLDSFVKQSADCFLGRNRDSRIAIGVSSISVGMSISGLMRSLAAMEEDDGTEKFELQTYCNLLVLLDQRLSALIKEELAADPVGVAELLPIR